MLYRNSRVGISAEPSQPSSEDKANFNTLTAVRKILSDGINGLYKDFNAFEVSDDSESIIKLRNQIAGKKEAYYILQPLLELIDSTLERINAQYRK